MVILHLLTAWIDVGDEKRHKYRPAVVDAYHLTDWEDVTGQDSKILIPDPNLMVLRVTCDEATAEAISADGEYQVLTVEAVEEETEREG